MSRDSSGNFSLVAGNPVVAGTTITDAWANSTLSDIGQALTDSLDRNGRGGMLAALKGLDGAVGTPAYTFTNESTTGFYRSSAGVIRVALSGVLQYQFSAGTFTVYGTGANPTYLQFTCLGSGSPAVISAGGSIADSDLKLQENGATGKVVVGLGIIAANFPVFTASQLKGRFVLARSTTRVNAPADTLENTVWTGTIPAGMLGTNGYIDLNVLWSSITATVSSKIIRVYFDGNKIYEYNDGIAGGGVRYFEPVISLRIANRNSANSQLTANLVYQVGSFISSVLGFSEQTVNTALAKNVTITMQKATAGDTMSLENVSFELCPSN